MEAPNTNTANIQQKLCLATVSNKEYWPGTLVMIKSFLKCNKWFKGEIVVITSEKEYIAKKIKKHSIEAKIVEPSPKLSENIRLIKDEIKQKKSQTTFLKLELFNLSGYDRIIFCDSDILHLQGINPFQFTGNLSAVLDPWFFRGFARERKTLGKVKIIESIAEVYEKYYNSGVLIIDKKLLNRTTYEQLISFIRPGYFAQITDIPTDEPVLNKMFENNFETMPVEYNCPVHLVTERIIKTPVFSVHFTGKYKPWYWYSWIFLLLRSKKYYPYLWHWLSCYYRNQADILINLFF